MPTIDTIASQRDMVSQVAYNFFKGDVSAANKSMLVAQPLQTSENFVNSGFGLNSNLSELVGDYKEEKSSFRDELKDAMDSLKDSSEKMKNSVNSKAEQTSATAAEEIREETTEISEVEGNLFTLKEFANGNIPPEELARMNRERNVERQRESEQNVSAEHRQNELINRIEQFAEEYLTAENSESSLSNSVEKETSAISTVSNFVDNYNSAMSYLNERSGLSNGISALASSFGDNKNFASSLNAIGISVNPSGQLSVNVEKLADALNEDSSNVDSVLGQEGLAGQLDKKVDLANYRNESLFPTITDYANENNSEQSESLYFARTLKTAMYAGEKSGGLLNMFT